MWGFTHGAVQTKPSRLSANGPEIRNSHRRDHDPPNAPYTGRVDLGGSTISDPPFQPHALGPYTGSILSVHRSRFTTRTSRCESGSTKGTVHGAPAHLCLAISNRFERTSRSVDRGGEAVARSHLHPGSNPRESTQKSHPNQGCIVSSSRRGDRIAAAQRGAKQIVRNLRCSPSAVFLHLSERFGDAVLLLVPFSQICGRVRIRRRDQELREPVRGENRRKTGGIWFVLVGDFLGSASVALFWRVSRVILGSNICEGWGN
jgi:hypothetical protein